MNYTLGKNQLYAKEGDPKYVARARVTKRLAKEDVISKIAYGCTLTEADVSAVLTSLEKVLVEYIALGCSIQLGFLSLGYSIRGGFDNELDGFRKDRNWISVNATVASSFSNAVNQAARPERVNAQGQTPNPLTLTKISGDMTITELEPGNLVRITGNKLAFDQVDGELGVFLRDENGNDVRAAEYGRIAERSVLLKMPNGLTSGINVLQVRSRKNDGKIVTGVLDAPVIIAA